MDNKKGSKSSIYFCDDDCKSWIIFIKNTNLLNNKIQLLLFYFYFILFFIENIIKKKKWKEMNFFFQKYFGILEIGQKKCPKMKIGKESWEFLHPHCIKIFSVTLFFEIFLICYDNF